MTAVYPLEHDEERALRSLRGLRADDRAALLASRLLELWSQIEDWERLAKAGEADPRRVAGELRMKVQDLVRLSEWRHLVADEIEAVRHVRNEVAHGRDGVATNEVAAAVERAEALVAHSRWTAYAFVARASTGRAKAPEADRAKRSSDAMLARP